MSHTLTNLEKQLFDAWTDLEQFEIGSLAQDRYIEDVIRPLAKKVRKEREIRAAYHGTHYVYSPASGLFTDEWARSELKLAGSMDNGSCVSIGKQVFVGLLNAIIGRNLLHHENMRFRGEIRDLTEKMIEYQEQRREIVRERNALQSKLDEVTSVVHSFLDTPWPSSVSYNQIARKLLAMKTIATICRIVTGDSRSEQLYERLLANETSSQK